jgi:hypothetical protein
MISVSFYVLQLPILTLVIYNHREAAFVLIVKKCNTIKKYIIVFAEN